MKVLILGYSDLVIRKILPAIEKTSKVNTLDIASKTGNVKDVNKLVTVYSDYNKALQLSDAEIVYVSLPNSLHYKYSKLSIEKNKNVIVDKPAILSADQLFSLKNLTKSNNLFISMSCVFNFHKAWGKFKKYSISNDQEGTLLAEFTIPKLNKNNIRMSNKLKGGAINDMGIYATTLGYLFWNTPSKKIIVNSYTKDSIVEGFTVLANYGRGKNLIGNFGFNQVYTNKITFSGNGIKTIYERVFSQPVTYESKIYKYTNTENKVFNIGKDDSFLNYLNYVVNNAKSNKKVLNDDFNKLNLEYLKLIGEYEKK